MPLASYILHLWRGNPFLLCLTLVFFHIFNYKPQYTKERREKRNAGQSINANKDPEIIAEGGQDGKVNYLTGNDPKKWKTNIPTYKAVIYKEVYPGIDIKYYGSDRQMEYDIIVKPGADAAKVKFAYKGIEDLKITDEGDMQINLKQGSIIQKKPYIYQEIDGKRMEVAGKFKVFHSTLSTDHSSLYSYSIQIASYDKSSPLFIDPVIIYSTYLGGSSTDAGYGIAVDSSGNAYITGGTYSRDFPTASAIQGTNAGYTDAFVTKIGESTSGTVWAWGRNDSGQLGDGTTLQRTTPVQVSGLTNMTAIAGGNYHTIAVKNDGTVWTWGGNWYGQLGDGTTTDRTNPVQVSGLTDVTSIAGGASHSIALK